MQGAESLLCPVMDLTQEPGPRAGASAGQVARLERQVDQLTEQVGQLTSAVESNRVIAAAMGILMERHQLDRAGAFRLLTRLSQSGNFKLRGIAEDLVEEAERASVDE
jgi:AmiR/NasT family two-component response regulator